MKMIFWVVKSSSEKNFLFYLTYLTFFVIIAFAAVGQPPCAGVAQPVEQLICNQQVGGSNPSTSSNLIWRSSRVAKGGRL